MSKCTIISDANILIDYLNGGEDLLVTVSEYSNFMVPDVILDEVHQLNNKKAEKLGIQIFECPLEVLAAAEIQLPGCSFQDTVCFLIAEQNDWICATNDKKLIRECKNNGVDVVRGLRLIINVVKSGKLTHKAATTAAKNIAAGNREITEKIVKEFIKLLG